MRKTMAACQAVVATHVGGIPETLRGGDNGLPVPPRDEQALARALARLLGDDALRDRLAERARNHRATLLNRGGMRAPSAIYRELAGTQ